MPEARQKTSFGSLATHKKKHIRQRVTVVTVSSQACLCASRRSMYSPRDLYSYPPSINSEIGWHLSYDLSYMFCMGCDLTGKQQHWS